MWSLFPKIYDDYKTLLYISSNKINTPKVPEKDSLPKLYCSVEEGTLNQAGKPNAPLDQKSCCMLMKKVREDLLKKNININNYMIIENCSTELGNSKK